MKDLTVVLLLLICQASAWSQQVPDSSFSAAIAHPRYPPGTGPVITVDAAHGNFHTLDDRYYAFGKVLSEDGYVLKSGEERFAPESLHKTRILVISNALDSTNLVAWELPTPSAFAPDEIAALKAWVSAGGRLFLIADHMPFAGAATELGKAFGFEFLNGYALDNRHRHNERFYRGNGSLLDHPITSGSQAGERIDTVVSFTGSAFRIPKGASPILELKHYTVMLTRKAGTIDESTPWVTKGPLYQGAVLQFGKGRVAVFGEAGMFSAQLSGPNRSPMGMNVPEAHENSRFLLNVVHWLDGL